MRLKRTKEMIGAEAQICLNCPFPKCKHSADGCGHYKAEMQKIKEKYRKGKKRNAVNKQNLKPTTQAV